MLVCPSCSSVVQPTPNDRIPPWCQKCGADLDPNAAPKAATPEHPPATEPTPNVELVTESPQRATEPEAKPFLHEWTKAAHSKKEPEPIKTSPIRGVIIGGVLSGIIGSRMLGPMLFPNDPDQMFNIAQTLFAGFSAAVGAMIGFVVGTFIDNDPGT